MCASKIEARAVTVSDRKFFPGTLATVNSLLRFHPGLPVFVVDNGLTEPQKMLLDRGGARVVPAARFMRPGRHIGPWELKAYAAAELARECDVLIGIDSDCIVCGALGDMIARCAKDAKWLGGQDGEWVCHDASYAAYGIRPGTRNSKYMSTSLYFCPVREGTMRQLDRWAECCAAAVFNGRGPYPGHGDQGVLNAVLFADGASENVELLPNTLWSQHWEYWQTVVYHGDGRLINARVGEPQRSLHCGGAEKFWAAEHSRRVATSNPSQLPGYAWFLAMLWFGECSDRTVDPFAWLPEESWHLVDDLVKWFSIVCAVLPEARRDWRPSNAFLERAVRGVRRAMSFGTSLDSYLALARTLRDGGKLVEVGSCEGGSILPVAISLLDRDVVCYSVESFTGNLDGTFDGWELPSPTRYVENAHHRFPHLRLISLPGRSRDVAAQFADGSLDMVFIDAAHDTPSVLADIDAWRPKLKPGGLLSGDDWSWPSVQEAVRARLPSVEVAACGAVWSSRV